jgi:hypothetical protein
VSDDSADDNVVDFGNARDRLTPERKEKKAKALRKQFQAAMGWKAGFGSNAAKSKATNSKGPKPKKGKKR